uniref:Tc3 transposase DNA binding domain-containing protein n=1 Tax=Strigamia maritima TaxID=126957 RepID=T1IYU7_STRMM
MGSGKRLNDHEKDKIDAYKELGLSNVEIGKKIRRSEKVIRNYLKLGANYGLKNPGGRPKCTTARARRHLIHKASNKCTSARALQLELGLDCSLRTIQRELKNTPHLKYTKPRRRPALKNIQYSAYSISDIKIATEEADDEKDAQELPPSFQQTLIIDLGFPSPVGVLYTANLQILKLTRFKVLIHYNKSLLEYHADKNLLYLS